MPKQVSIPLTFFPQHTSIAFFFPLFPQHLGLIPKNVFGFGLWSGGLGECNVEKE